jgi:glycopeptide antibiotics resistance protein
MFLKEFLSNRMTHDRVTPAFLVGGALFLFSFGIHFLLLKLGVPAAATVLDDLALAVLGALLFFFYVSAISLNQEYKRAKERIILIAELNHHIREALTVIQCSDTIADENDRAHCVQEAVQRIDWVLTDLVPTIGSAKKPRLYSPEQN